MSPLFLLSASIAYLYSVEGQQTKTCPQQDGIRTECKSLYECDVLLELVRKTNRTPEEVERLKNSQCGQIGTAPAVCCPEQCFTPDGTIGSCIDIYKCPRLLSMLKPPPSPQNVEYIKKSICEGPAAYSVCCGPPADPNPRKGNCANSLTAYPPNPVTNCCGADGFTGNKIYGGNATAVDQYPWLTLIEYVSGGLIKLLCGGSLISSKYVLTAAHCITGEVLSLGTPKNVRLGEYDTENDGKDCAPVEAEGMDCTEGVVIVPIELTIPHPEYNAPSKRNDIGLIRLRSRAPFTDFIRPICLPSQDFTLNPPAKFIMYAAGWGAINSTHLGSNVKMDVDLPFRSNEVCQQGYRSNSFNINLSNKQLCAGGEKGKDSCRGDSGGPLMYENGKIFEIIGIVSFGLTPCGKENVPGVYSNVYQYNDWIKKNIKP